MALQTIPLPGRIAGKIGGVEVTGLGVQCPYCSRTYDEYDYDKGEKVEVPTTCRRCGSPMEPGEKALEFANAKAQEEHRDVTVPGATKMDVAEALRVLRDAGFLPENSGGSTPRKGKSRAGAEPEKGDAAGE